MSDRDRDSSRLSVGSWINGPSDSQSDLHHERIQYERLDSSDSFDNRVTELDNDPDIDPRSHLLLHNMHAAQQYMYSEPKKYEAMELEYEKQLFDFDYRLEDRLFGWLPAGYDKTFKDSCCKSFACFCVFLLGPYCFGFSMFAILNQQITLWDTGLSNPSLIKGNISCAGMATQCTFGGQFINFKAYVQYRLAAYVMLLIPFMYIPFMTVMDISNTAMKVWETIRAPVKSPQKQNKPVQVLRDREETFAANGSRREFTRKQTLHNWRNYSSSDHEYMLLRLFGVFHIILGIFSLAFDILVAMANVENQLPCKILNDNLGKLATGPEWLTIRFIGLYSTITGTLYLAMTFAYMYNQYAVSLQRQTFKEDIHNEKLRGEKQHHEAAIAVMQENEKQILAEKEKLRMQFHEHYNSQNDATAKLEMMQTIEKARKEGQQELRKNMKANYDLLHPGGNNKQQQQGGGRNSHRGGA